MPRPLLNIQLDNHAEEVHFKSTNHTHVLSAAAASPLNNLFKDIQFQLICETSCDAKKLYYMKNLLGNASKYNPASRDALLFDRLGNVQVWDTLT